MIRVKICQDIGSHAKKYIITKIGGNLDTGRYGDALEYTCTLQNLSCSCILKQGKSYREYFHQSVQVLSFSWYNFQKHVYDGLQLERHNNWPILLHTCLTGLLQ